MWTTERRLLAPYYETLEDTLVDPVMITKRLTALTAGAGLLHAQREKWTRGVGWGGRVVSSGGCGCESTSQTETSPACCDLGRKARISATKRMRARYCRFGRAAYL
ncbi:hypothetical protein BaRGS_00036145 [Batillaria attramentaria]|uniref:Uncharacterized protein n=1 Tax=Batillaria attramentaria TaxID=370345 RepID=A0ABD0JE01_9CAEN